MVFTMARKTVAPLDTPTMRLTDERKRPPNGMPVGTKASVQVKARGTETQRTAPLTDEDVKALNTWTTEILSDEHGAMKPPEWPEYSVLETVHDGAALFIGTTRAPDGQVRQVLMRDQAEVQAALTAAVEAKA